MRRHPFRAMALGILLELYDKTPIYTLWPRENVMPVQRLARVECDERDTTFEPSMLGYLQRTTDI